MYRQFLSSAFLTTVFLIGLQAGPALAQQAANFSDMPSEHWAAKAVTELVEKYGVMAGYPDASFQGMRNISRYEAAAAFYKVMLQVSQVEELTRRIGNVALEDLKVMKALHEEFQQEIDVIKKQQGEQADQIKRLEESLVKLKEDLGSVRFGGRIAVGVEDVFEDNFRPGYRVGFSLNTRIAATDKTTIRSSMSGSFSSIQTDNDKGEEGKKSQFSEQKNIKVGFGEAWFDHRVGGFLSPRVKFGYIGVTRLILPFTSIPHQFDNSIIDILDDSAVGRASPNILGSSRGIRLPAPSFLGGAEFSEGFFSGALAATPEIFYAQVGLNLGLVRLKLISEGDQALFIGEPVLDTLHNHTAILDIGNDTLGLSAQATFRGLADEFAFRGAGSNFNASFNGFSLGASGRFEAEKTYQQLIGGLYFSTPSNLKQINEEWADTSIPSVLLAIQSPFTLDNGGLFEGSPDEIGDLAGFMIQVTYDNPIIPNLTVEFGRRQKVFMNRLPTDVKFDKTTIALNSTFVF